MDPLSTKAAVAAIGAANNATKGGVFGNLLGPISKAYGDDWGERAQERIKAAKERRRRENLDEHLKAAEAEGIAGDVDPGDFEKWLEAVSAVDPRDKELSAAWLAMLKALASGSPYRHGLLKALREMSAEEVLEFTRLGFWTFSMDHRERFKELKLLKPMAEGLLWTAMFMCIACFAWFFSLKLFEGVSVPASWRIPETQRSTARVLIWLVFGSYVGSAAWFFYSRPRLTRLGRVLQRLIRSQSRLSYRRANDRSQDLPPPPHSP